MLAVFREHTKGLITWAFVILVSIPFVFFGVGQFSSLVISNYVAKVNGEKIMPNVFQDAYRQAYQQASPNGNLSPAREKELKQQVLQQLINQTLIQQQAQADRLVVLKAEIRAEVNQISAFQSNGRFNLAQYKAVLASNGLSPDAFEARVEQQLVTRQLQGGLGATAFVTPVEFTSMISLLKEKRTVAWVTFPLTRYPAAPPDEKMIAAYYQSHQQKFVTRETLTLNYVQLDKTALEKKIEVTPQELQSFYETHQILYGVPTARKAAQILIKPKNNSPQGWAQAKSKAVHILKLYREKNPSEKRFSELAKKYSDDFLTRRNGGSMGWVARGQTNNGFGNALFSIAKKGQVAGPVKTPNGWSLIRLLGVRTGSVQPFAAVKNKVIAAYRAKQAKNLYYQLGDKLANLAYEHPGSLAPIAKELGLKVTSISGVTRNSGRGIAGSKVVRKVAFSHSVLNQGMNSAPVKIGPQNALFSIAKKGQVAGPVKTPNGWSLIRLLGVRTGSVQPFAAVKNKVIAAYRAKQAKNLYYQLGDKLANLAYEHPGSLAPIAKELGLKVTSISGVTRNSGRGIAGSKVVRKVAFSHSVLNQGMNSAPVKIGPQNAVILRISQVHKSQVKPLATVKSQIIALLLRQETSANARRAAEHALTKIEAGEPIANVTKSLHLKLMGPKVASRGASKLPPELVAAVFSLAPNPQGKPQFGLIELVNGIPVVYELIKVTPGRITELKKPEAELYQTQIAQINAQAFTASYLSWLRKRADIVIEKKNIP